VPFVQRILRNVLTSCILQGKVNDEGLGLRLGLGLDERVTSVVGGKAAEKTLCEFLIVNITVRVERRDRSDTYFATNISNFFSSQLHIDHSMWSRGDVNDDSRQRFI